MIKGKVIAVIVICDRHETVIAANIPTLRIRDFKQHR